MDTAERSEERVIHLAPFGKHTKYMLGRYLAHVLMVTAVLLAIALTIDLFPQFELIMASGGSGPLAPVWSIVRFSALRTPWLVAPFLPFATYLGVFWTELTHTLSGERMLVWNSGRSPVQCLAPVVLLGLLLGAGEIALDVYFGPASMAVQMQERLGLDGRRLDRTRTSKPSWIALPDGLLRAEIEYGPPPVLHHVTFFRRDAAGRLAGLESAAIARRLPGTDQWEMEDGYFWRLAGTASGGGEPPPALLIGGANETVVPFARRTVPLDVEPLWLSVFGMEPQYVPLDVLQRLVRIDRDPESLSRYRTRLNTLYGETVLPAAMAVLAASLSMLMLAYGASLRALITIPFVGYMAHFATKACLLMGQTGYMAPVLAGWLVPLGLLGASAAVLAAARLRRSRSTNAE